MQDDPRTAPLKEWNRLARENTENAIISSMLDATIKASEPLEVFSNWLLVAAGAVASVILSNSEKVVDFVGEEGFYVGGALLCFSATFGLLSRVFALRCRIGILTGAATKSTFEEHLQNYKFEEEKIQEGAKFWGITLESGIRTDRVLQEFLAPFPWLVRKLAQRHFKNHKGSPQIAYIILIKSLSAQGAATFLQALAFIGLFGVGFIWGKAI